MHAAGERESMADQRALELIQEERFLEFNNYVESLGGTVDLSGAHLRAFEVAEPPNGRAIGDRNARAAAAPGRGRRAGWWRR